MALDRIAIGARIRRIREEIFEESREQFGKRCDLTERHVGQLERGDFLIGLVSLDSIVSSTGIDADYILYGKGDNNKLQIKENLYNIIDKSEKDELKMYYTCITAIKNYVNKK
ncbi:MAG: helix-turn-helix transcriptional regulator [Clostridia bacterium]|nr:helix-turn-helix transcriptional regulator [Clostridia bacterium]